MVTCADIAALMQGRTIISFTGPSNKGTAATPPSPAITVQGSDEDHGVGENTSAASSLEDVHETRTSTTQDALSPTTENTTTSTQRTEPLDIVGYHINGPQPTEDQEP